MDTQLIKLYDEEELIRLKAKKRAWIAVLMIVALAALAFCAFFMARAVRLRSPAQLLRSIASAVAGGWICLTIRIFAADELAAEVKHAQAMLSGMGSAEVFEGAFTLAEKPLRIKRGAALRRVSCTGGNTPLSIWEKNVKRFPAERVVRVHAVNGLIAAYEVEDENN